MCKFAHLKEKSVTGAIDQETQEDHLVPFEVPRSCAKCAEQIANGWVVKDELSKVVFYFCSYGDLVTWGNSNTQTFWNDLVKGQPKKAEEVVEEASQPQESLKST